MESTPINKMSSRRPPFYTCGLSFMVIADHACSNVQQFNGPLGFVTKKIAKIVLFASPFVYALESQLLLVFSLLDNWIFAFERAVEAIFPSSGYAFDKIDQLVGIAEILPGKYDEVVSKFPEIIHQIPFLDYVLSRAISFLSFFVSALSKWGSGNIKEKEIEMDMICNDRDINEKFVRKGFESEKDGIKEEDGSLTSTSPRGENETTTTCSYKDALEKAVKVTYKDILEKGSKENTPSKANSETEETEIKYDENKEATTKGEMEKIEKREDNVKKKRKKSKSGKKGAKQKIEKQEKSEKDVTEEPNACKEVNGDGNCNKMEEKVSNGEELLDLFESAWLASPRNN
ncbi:uncharacterized protein LOC126657767 [Mercurialis annua]|uniref:uncharacterized protein LOC126657767 n=1 Tax=Mercurialis annua TaxID=3986 RepID=UPI00215FEE6A|nr:uncharacterized protein LOC126657767 [Mercurialis annua]